MQFRAPRKALAAAAAGACALGVIAAPAYAAPGKTLQQKIDDHIAAYGGVQISDSTIAWEGGPTLTFADTARGQKKAPTGLGRNVRQDKVNELGLNLLANPRLADVEGCPSGWTVRDAYCFYTHSYFGGDRLTFWETCQSTASNWGFNDTTSSWVNTSTGKTIRTYRHADFTDRMWTEYSGSKSAVVASSYNDAMSSWFAC